MPRTGKQSRPSPIQLKKLPIIRGDLVRNDPEWESWGFVKFTEALRKQPPQNPIDNFKLACSKQTRKEHENVFTAKRKITSRQNLQKSPHRQNAENFWVQKGSVSIALVRTNHRNAKAPRPINTVVRDTTPRSAAHQRK